MIPPGHYYLNPRRLSWSEVFRLSGLLLPFGVLYKFTGQASDLSWLPELSRENQVSPADLDPKLLAGLSPSVDFLLGKGFQVAAWKVSDPRSYSRVNLQQGACCMLWKGQTGAFIGHVLCAPRQTPAMWRKNTVISLVTHRRDGISLATTDFAKGLDPHPDGDLKILRAPLPVLLEEHQRRCLRLGEKALSFSNADAFLDCVDSQNSKVFAWRIAKGLYVKADPGLWPEIMELMQDLELDEAKSRS